MLCAMDTEFEPNPDDEREVDLSDEFEPPAPAPTLDPEERIEDTDDEDVRLDEDREA
jgi:hypothetical protein